MRKPVSTSLPEDLVPQIDAFVRNSGGTYKDRSHLVEQAIRSYMGDDLPMAELLTRVYGDTLGAVAPSSPSLYETSLFPRLSVNTREKRAIAEEAACLVDKGQTLFIEGGTTCIELAKVLASQQKGLTVVTNSTLICLELGRVHGSRIICPGGEYDPFSTSFVGRSCEEALERFYVDLAILSTKGFLPAEGTFESTVGTLRVKQVVARSCGGVVLLVDHTKFGQRSLCKVLDISQVHTVVTDSQAPPAAIERLRGSGHRVLVAEPTGGGKQEAGDAA